MRPAPIKPPIRAWEELLGNPSHQVMRFHTMAPTRADRMIRLSTKAGFTIPVPMVVAT